MRTSGLAMSRWHDGLALFCPYMLWVSSRIIHPGLKNSVLLAIANRPRLLRERVNRLFERGTVIPLHPILSAKFCPIFSGNFKCLTEEAGQLLGTQYFKS